MKIASLEDDLDQARRIQQVLTAAGYTCSSYQQSRDLLSAMRNESFDLVLLDWHLPDIDGDDVVRWLRANIGPHPGHFPDQPLQRGRPGRRAARRRR